MPRSILDTAPFKSRNALPVAALAVLVGVMVVVTTLAATAPAAFETETGVLTAGAMSTAVVGASAGSVVKFGLATTPTPSPAASPVMSACPAYPAFPDANCTGWQHTGVTLTAYTGSDTISTDNTVIDGKDINTCLYITANNVTIKNSRIRCASSSPTEGGTMVVQQSNYYTPNVTGLFITDTEITRPAGSKNGADYGLQLYGKNVVLTRVNIGNLTSGIHTSNACSSSLGYAADPCLTMRDSYIHDLVNISGVDHNDGIIANGSASNVSLAHNNLENPLGEVTPIAMYPEGTPNINWTIDKNLLNGGGACIYYGYTKGSEQPNSHLTFTNNHFGRKFYSQCGANGVFDSGRNGSKFSDGASNVWSGNVWDDTGAAIDPT